MHEILCLSKRELNIKAGGVTSVSVTSLFNRIFIADVLTCQRCSAAGASRLEVELSSTALYSIFYGVYFTN